MAHLFANRVWETTTTTGTGNLTLLGRGAASYQRFGEVLVTGDTCEGFVAERAGSGWEVTTFTMQSDGTLARASVPYSSSNAGAKVSFGSGIKDVVLDEPAEITAATNRSNTFALDQFFSQNLGIGTSTGVTGLTVTAVFDENASGYSNVRIGLASGGSQPSFTLEHAGFQRWGLDNFQGLLRFVHSQTAVLAQFDVHGGFALGTDGVVAVNQSCCLDLQSTTRGLGLPNISTATRDAIVNPAVGMLIFNSTTSKLNFWDGGTWRVVTST